MTTLPCSLPDALLDRLLAKIGSEFEPERVPVRPAPYAVLLDCYANVEEKVRRDGGRPHYGWRIHQTALLYEAERHAVWEAENGELVDVTPHEPAVEEVCFVPDDNWVYTGQLVDNIRVNRTTNPLVDDFILLAETITQVYAYSTPLGGQARAMPPAACAAVVSYQQLKEELLAFIRRGAQPYTACYCGVGRPYKSCHGYQLRQRIGMAMRLLQRQLGRRQR